MELDADVCLCFRVTRRKLLQFARVEQPEVASRFAECGGAGTGCGWCVPFLRQIFEEARGTSTPFWETLSADDYRRQRAEYLRSGPKGKPSSGGDGGV